MEQGLVSIFEAEETGFGFETSGEACEFSRGSDDPVAGHDDGDGVAPVGCADGSAGGGDSELLCELPVASRLTEGDREKSLPYIFLERSTAHIERKVERLARTCEVFAELLLGPDEDRVVRLFDETGERDPVWFVVLPEDGDETFIAGNELEPADGGVHEFVEEAH